MATKTTIQCVRDLANRRGEVIKLSNALGYKDPNAIRAWIKKGSIPARVMNDVEKFFTNYKFEAKKPTSATKAKPKAAPKAKPVPAETTSN